MKEGLISIIVPVYNAEAYLSTCVDSIIHQTHQEFELILINDGSTDNSKTICDNYQKKDNRIKVFHIDNQGVSHARNVGLSYAQGEFITFIDCDDYVDPDYLESYIQHKEYDCVVGGHLTFPSIRKVFHNDFVFNTSDSNNGLNNYVPRLDGSCWGKLYHHSIIQEHHIRFNEGMRFSEDTDFCLHYLRYAHTIKTITNTGYHYRILPNNHVEKKYRLTKEELDKNLSILLNDYQELEKNWNTEINHSNFRISIACYPIENVYSLQSDKEYYDLYYKYFYHNDKESFYKDPICSPYVRTITAIKNDFLDGNRKKGRQLMRNLQSFYGQQPLSIDYPYPLYKTYATLISKRQFIVAECLFFIFSLYKKYFAF